MDIRFDNRFVRELPGDPNDENTRRQVHRACYSRVTPTTVRRPTTLAISDEVADVLGLSGAFRASPDFANVFGGNTLLEGMEPFAACYGGHQFGHWAGQLGDGRAITLGELVAPDGSRHELQLKGAGPTPYSRTADGRAVLRSSVREFLCSEAMHHLGVPTTRALSLVGTGELVVRDMFYDGRPRPEPGAIVCRVAPTFIRFGNFEIFAARGDHDTRAKLADFTISQYFPEIDVSAPDRYRQWFLSISARTARLVVEWMRVGFVHGVMNTDNMSILGLTIDYGPYGWLEDFDPHWTPNTTDAQGKRYRYGHQPHVAHWNVARLGEALLGLLTPEDVEAGLDVFADTLEDAQKKMVAQKLGLGTYEDGDATLVQDFYELLARSEADMTIAFRQLGEVDPAAATLAPLESAFYDPDKRAAAGDAWQVWLDRWGARVSRVDDAQRRETMRLANPRFVFRNYLAQLAIDAAEKGDVQVLHDLLDTLRRPYDEQPDRDNFAQRRPDWAKHRAGCSMLSCSS